MAFETGSYSSIPDLLSKLDTFLVANGWTSDEADTTNGRYGWSKNTVHWSVQYNTTTPQVLAIYQATAAGSGTALSAHTGDSGNGVASATNATANATLSGERSVDLLANTGGPAYWFFANGDSIHIVCEAATDTFRHFGAGLLSKFGTFTGGAYCYGHSLISGSITDGNNTALLDGLFTNTGASNIKRAATIRIEGMAGQAGSSIWGQIWGNPPSTTPPTDRAGNAKICIQGGHRGGPVARASLGLFAGAASGLVPGYPIDLFYMRGSASLEIYYLGYMPDVRGVNIFEMVPRDIIVIGSDDWYFFPIGKKLAGGTIGQTGNAGIMYKKTP